MGLEEPGVLSAVTCLGWGQQGHRPPSSTARLSRSHTEFYVIRVSLHKPQVISCTKEEKETWPMVWKTLSEKKERFSK